MGISKATVDKATAGTYIERIRGKLQVGNKAELIRAALERQAQPGLVMTAPGITGDDGTSALTRNEAAVPDRPLVGQELNRHAATR